MTSTTLRLAAVLAAGPAVLSLACAGPDLTPPQTSRAQSAGDLAPAILILAGDTALVALPQAARVHEAVRVTVTSFGNGCTTAGQTETVVAGLVAVVRPLSVEPPPGTVCTMELRTLTHTTVLRFSDPGEATVRVLGSEQPGDTPVVLDRRITVTS
jgi:hypothetical protein